MISRGLIACSTSGPRPHFLERAGPEIFDQDIGRTDQAFENVLPFSDTQVHGDGFLVARDDGPEHAGLIHFDGAPVARRVGSIRRFDFDHLGAESHPAIGHKRDPAMSWPKFNHAKPRKRRLYNRFCHSFSMPAKQAAMTRRIDIVEVGPRDGLQNDPADLSTQQKLEFISRLEACGVKTNGVRLLRVAQGGSQNGR